MFNESISFSNLHRQELDNETMASNESATNSGNKESGSEELSGGEFGYSSDVESGLVPESTVARQLQLAETEPVTRLSLCEDALFLFLVLVRLCLDDFLGKSEK